MMAGKKWWIWLLLMQQNMQEKQKGGTLVQRLEAMCHG